MSNKDLIKQYVSTGSILPRHQVNKLPSNILKTYLRRRLQQSDADIDTHFLRNYEIVKLSEKLGNRYLSNFSTRELFELIVLSAEPDKIINLAGEKGKRLVFDVDNMKHLLGGAEAPDRIIKVLLSNKEFVSNNILDNIPDFLIPLKDRDKFINILLDNKEFVSKLGVDDILDLLRFSTEPDNLINKLGEKGKQYINNLNVDDIRFLLRRPRNPEKIKQVLMKYGHEV